MLKKKNYLAIGVITSMLLLTNIQLVKAAEITTPIIETSSETIETTSDNSGGIVSIDNNGKTKIIQQENIDETKEKVVEINKNTNDNKDSSTSSIGDEPLVEIDEEEVLSKEDFENNANVNETKVDVPEKPINSSNQIEQEIEVTNNNNKFHLSPIMMLGIIGIVAIIIIVLIVLIKKKR